MAKMARIYLFPLPLGHHLLQMPRGKYHIPECSLYSISSTASLVDQLSLFVHQNQIPQKWSGSSLLTSANTKSHPSTVKGWLYFAKRQYLPKSHQKHTATQKNKWFLIKRSQLYITSFTQIFSLKHCWEGRWGESLCPQNSHALLFPWEILHREVL